MSKRNTALRLYGFEEFVEALTKATNQTVDQVAEKAFDECADIVVHALDDRMNQANVPADLKNKAQTFRRKKNGQYMFSYGWTKDDESTFKKVVFLNYGTPSRHTRTGGQRVQIDGKWVTLGTDRGREEGRAFISNAKRSAAQKMRKVYKDALAEITGGLK